MIHLLPAEILLIYSLTFLKPGESMPGLQEVSTINAKKHCRLVTILKAETTAMGRSIRT
jgi:hypothetical protein